MVFRRDFSLGKPPYAAVEGPPYSSQRSLVLCVRKLSSNAENEAVFIGPRPLRRNHKMCYAVSPEILSRSGVYGVTEVSLRRNLHLGLSSAVTFKWLRRRDNVGSELFLCSPCYAVFPITWLRRI